MKQPSFRHVGRRLSRFFRDELNAIPVVVFLTVLVLIGITQSPYFLSPINLGNLVVQITALLLVSLGQTLVIGSGGLDLSVGGIVALGAVTTAVLFAPLGIPAALLIGLAVSVAAGVVNGFAVSQGLAPFLVTLGMLAGTQGLALLVNPVPGGTVPAEFAALAGYTGAVPNVLVPLLLVIIVMVWVSKRSRLSAHLLAIGGDQQVAVTNKIKLVAVSIKTYAISGLMAGLAAWFIVARTRTGDPTAGASLPLDSIAAVVLGGTLLSGGRITMIGTVLGAISLGMLSNVLNLLGIGAEFQTLVKGLLILTAVLLPYLFFAGKQRFDRNRNMLISVQRK